MKVRFLLYPALGIVVVALSLRLSPEPQPLSLAGPSAQAEAPLSVASPWSAEVDALEEQLHARRDRAERSESWIDWESVSHYEAERARLLGDYKSYVRASEALDQAFALAPEGTGPFASRASLNMRLHRLSRVEQDLQAMESAAVLTSRDKNRIKAIRADLAFYSGEMKKAKELYSEVAKAEPTVRSLAALARLAWKSGDMALAKKMLDRAEQRAPQGTKSDRAWLKLVRGLIHLDQGKLDEALAMYQEGLTIVPGYWLLEEHVAEVVMLKGDSDRALKLYEDLVVRTSNPEFMDQIASIWRERGQTRKFEYWRDRAAKLYEQQLALVPEAAIGHALDHYLELENDHQYTLSLAKQNHQTRPGGEAKEKLVAAYLLAGNAVMAQRVAAEMIDGGWKTADSLALSALAHERVGHAKRAAADAAAARALAPLAEERVDWLREAIGA